jgi:type II secretion system protein N
MKISIFGYVIFVLLCIFISGYRHFPTDTASKYVQHEISRFNSNLNLSIDGIKPVFPPGIKADTILVNYAGNLVGELEKFKLGFDLFSIFRDANKYHFKTGAKDGVISGTITLPEKEQGLAILESEFKTLLLDHLSLGEKL